MEKLKQAAMAVLSAQKVLYQVIAETFPQGTKIYFKVMGTSLIGEVEATQEDKVIFYYKEKRYTRTWDKVALA